MARQREQAQQQRQLKEEERERSTTSDVLASTDSLPRPRPWASRPALGSPSRPASHLHSSSSLTTAMRRFAGSLVNSGLITTITVCVWLVIVVVIRDDGGGAVDAAAAA